MDLSIYYQEFTDALLHAFNENELTMLVKFRFNQKLTNIVGPGPLTQRVFELIAWADAEGKVDDLFAAAIERRPNNSSLKALAAKLVGETDTIQQKLVADVSGLNYRDYESPDAEKVRAVFSGFETNGALQALIVKVPNLKVGQEVLDWEKRQREARKRVCSIALHGEHKGTGFLIGQDRIMTNSHVVPAGALAGYDVAFDYLHGKRESLPKLKISAELARSAPKEFDFVILRLEKAPSGARGYFRAKAHQFDKVREPVSILGHSNGDPLSISYGVVFDNNSYFSRVAYTANTGPGSSGSPVFSENWDLVALHHHGEANVNNHGIPMKSILGHLGHGAAGLLEEA